MTDAVKTYKPRDEARIQAMLFDEQTAAAALEWAGNEIRPIPIAPGHYEVFTLEGWVEIPIGHYLIRGTNQEFYPCAPDVFVQRWEETPNG